MIFTANQLSLLCFYIAVILLNTIHITEAQKNSKSENLAILNLYSLLMSDINEADGAEMLCNLYNAAASLAEKFKKRMANIGKNRSFTARFFNCQLFCCYCTVTD